MTSAVEHYPEALKRVLHTPYIYLANTLIQFVAGGTLPGELLRLGAEERVMKAFEEQVTIHKSQDNERGRI